MLGLSSREEAVRRRTATLAELAHENEGLGLLGITHSHIRGNKGTIEFFLWVSKETKAGGEKIDINSTVEAAVILPAWDKKQRRHNKNSRGESPISRLGRFVSPG